MKKIIIIGNGFSAWSVANAFLNKNVQITIIGKKKSIFGAQQLSPNGFKALKKLTENDDIKNIIYEIIQFQINNNNNNKTKNLKNFYFNEFDLKYHSVSRDMLINLLIKNIKNKIEIKEINKSCVGIIQRNNKKFDVLVDNEELISANVIIGADGVNGVTRKHVCGTTNIIKKKVFRGISNDKNKLLLKQKTLELNFSNYGHFVSYPFIKNNKKYINYVFIPNKIFQNSNEILDKLKSISNFSSVNWNEGYFYFFEDEIQTLHKNNILLFGDAGFSFEPHLAQVGNNIIEDARYLKFLLDDNSSYNEIFENFSINTCKKKIELKTISNIVGISFGINTFTKLRNSLVSNLSDQLMCNFLKKVWYD